METKVTSPALKGTLIALVLIVFGLAIYFTGQSQNKALSSIGLVLYAVAIAYSAIYYAKQKNGNVTFGNAFADGFKTSAAATALFVVYTFIAIKFIMPDIVDLSIEEARKNMVEKKMSPEQVDAGIAMTQRLFIPFAVGGALFIYLIVGLIASLIGAAIAKKNPEASPFA
ncbi:DUF4199 domain-containing protein [Parasediminibacterium paludis]|uniref:DUF4199 domain-containing protein n=1 Tax=Parasediminibacterium paludis TaxID=908966 RepID=A0ABV8Q0P2_9BACT